MYIWIPEAKLGTIWQPVANDQSYYQSPTCTIVMAKMKKIKDVTKVNWQIVREACRETASNNGVWDMYRGFGQINVDDAIQYIEDNYLTADAKNYLTDKYNQRAGSNPILDRTDFHDNSPLPKRLIPNIYWDDDNNTYSFDVPDGGSIQIGQEPFDYYTNLEGAQIVDGDIVSSVGASGRRTAICLTDATNDAKSMAVLGMVTVATIGNNTVGRITKNGGKVRGLNTNAYNEGDVLWVNPASKGKWTATEPAAGNNKIKIGIVTVKHATQGVVELQLQVIPKLDNLSNVDGTDTAISDTDVILKKDTVWKSVTWANVKTLLGGVFQTILTFSTDIEADKASTTKISAIKTFYDWAVGLFSKKPISLTYSDLYSLTQTSGLTVGQRYIINDYQTVYNIPNAFDENSDPVVNTGQIEPLLVTALSTSKLMNIAYSTLFPQDIIYYDIESNQTMVEGCTKGYIYRRIDTLKNNDIGFDYRNAKFRRWQMDVTTTDTDGAQSDYTKGNVVKKTGTNEVYIKLNDIEAVEFTDTASWKRFEFDNLSYIIPQEGDWYLINDAFQVIIQNSGMYFDFYMFSTAPTTSGVQSSYNNIFKNKFDGNNSSIITASNTVFFGNNFNSNTIGNNFNSNTIGNDFYSNTIGNGFNNNTIGNGFSSNTIGNGFSSNTIGNDFSSNTIGNDFNSNTIGNNFYSNTIGNGFNNNTIGNGFSSNTIGNGFYSNTIGNGFSSNTIGNNFNNNGGLDFTSATYVYQQYNKELFTNSENEQYLKYYDGDNVLQIVLANA
jgi:hypothetical protein